MKTTSLTAHIDAYPSDYIRAKIVNGAGTVREAIDCIEAIALANTAPRPELVALAALVCELLVHVFEADWVKDSQGHEGLVKILTANQRFNATVS